MSVAKHYRSKKTGHPFTFRFVELKGAIDVYVIARPSLNGQDPSVVKTHLYESGKICFVEGKAPQTQKRAEELAGQWAEYFCEYRRTGVAQA